MMKTNRITIEHTLYALALAMALWIRLLNLGAAPLSDLEADWALQALSVAHGEQTVIGPQPGYVFLTGSTFSLLGSSNAAARLWPALVGGLLVIVPFLFRGLMGRRAALILAFVLALDPGLVALSRMAGGPILALGFGMLALGFMYFRIPILAGTFAGLASLSGPAVIPGILGLGLAFVIVKALENAGILTTKKEQEHAPDSTLRGSLRIGILSAGVTVFIAGSLFFRFPHGLGAWIATIPAYLKGWVELPGVPPLRLLAALVVYQPIAVIFGLIGAVRVWIRGRWSYSDDSHAYVAQRISLWMMVALVLALLYPARQVGDVVWALLPLWALGAMELAQYLKAVTDHRMPFIGQAVLIFLLFAFLWLNISGESQAQPEVQFIVLRVGMMVGVFALGSLTTVLVGLGWSWDAARRGLVLGLCTALGVYSLAVLWGVSQLRPGWQQELWSPAPTTGEAELLLSTLDDLSNWQTGRKESIDLTVAGDEPSLRWALRDFHQVRFISEPQMDSSGHWLAPGELPSVIITRGSQEAPSLAESYRGQDFNWWIYPGWAGVLPPDFTSWLVFRQAPLHQEQVILWARGDLFPGGMPESQDETTSDEDSGSFGEKFIE